eukprot:m.174549 g.174549  ORF g.174549 m.174549 type:complete len:467 (-) comp14593_c1_seq1:363-1763(-)
MEHVKRRSRRQAKQEIRWDATADADEDPSDRHAQYAGHTLGFYRSPPGEDLALEEFERFGIDRLKTLKALENAKVRFPQRGPAFAAEVTKQLKMNQLFWLAGDSDELKHRDVARKDHISHYILRLAFCRTEELRRWFMQQEAELFRFRLEQADPTEKTAIIKSEVHELTPASAEECARFDMSEAYRIPFENALDLVRARRVALSAGFAFVKPEDLTSIILGKFRAALAGDLAKTAQALPQLEEDERLMPRLMMLSKQDIGHDTAYTAAHDVTPASIPQLAKQSFPLCMRVTEQTLVKTHHLRHGARLQYGLFLKGIGLSLDGALQYWRSEFTKSISAEQFDKNYAYNIRYNYGKEGKRTNYTPYGCMKIINSSPGSGDSHGCPFKHYNEANLRSTMLAFKVPKDAIHEIISLVDGHHYQIACARYFEATHTLPTGSVSILHPNSYFSQSREILEQQAESAAAEPKK